MARKGYLRQFPWQSNNPHQWHSCLFETLSFCSLSFFCPFFSRRSVTIILIHRSRYLRWNHFPPLLVNANCTRSNELATQIYLEFHIYTYARVKSFEFLDILLWWTVFHFQTLLLVSKTRMNLDRRTRKHLLCECFLSPYCSPGVATSWYQDYRLVQSTNLTKFSTHGIEIRHQLSNLCRTWLLTAQVGLIWSGVTHSLTRLTSFINVMLLGGSGHF